MNIELESVEEGQQLAQRLGGLLRGGEVIELVGDVGAGKTTFTKGLALGLGIDDDVQSPTFTISRVYKGRDALTMTHYDFYRLSDAGILKDELAESISDKTNITVIEWAGLVEGVLPDGRLRIEIITTGENTRTLMFETKDESIKQALGAIG